MMSSTPLADNYLHSGPLETLAAMTGGASYRAEVGAEAAFERVGARTVGILPDRPSRRTRRRRRRRTGG